ncbi:MAG: VWA domain-containing protein [Candidatus Riflebacteria bacterium]|nr:VWA domain-containing protein [Candidatus Riflebacteria bacterium]
MIGRLLLILALFGTAFGQGLSTRLSQADIDRYPEVGVLLTVFSEAGKPVPGLTKDDFTLDEDGNRVSIVSVVVEKAPISVALVLDTSGSMQPAMAELKRAVGEFIRTLEPEDRALLITFSDWVLLNQPLTASRRGLLNAVESLKADGATALYDAMERAVRELRSVRGRRLAVVFTDGRDQNKDGTAAQSAIGARQVAQMAKDCQVPLWSIGLGPAVDGKFLGRLSQVTGGQSYLPAQAGALRKAFARVLTDVRLQYRVVYRSPKPQPDGTKRTITVTSASQGKTGQGKITYQAPLPPPPEPSPSPAATAVPPASSGGEQVMEVGGQIQKAQLTIELTGELTVCGIKIWAGQRNPDPKAKPVDGGFTPRPRVFHLDPGKYVVEAYHWQSSEVLGLYAVELKPGQKLTMRVNIKR